ncbi:conserved hypothetical protein [Vibrio jasicida]|uniref:Uncharacterized protein n=1 Tax=Vibrio jasicida TaxID=766224 RepID=A0AAU9QS73_9VIBR|nr:conserved hypothetical protein [Vibrio jasicida]CAH1599217.1 conserved hypothetical protein [Vibrio jasicida]
MKINRDIKNYVCHTFTVGDADFYVMVHYCGEVLLCTAELGTRACRLDCASIGTADGEPGHWILKHNWEPKIKVSSFDQNKMIELSHITGMPFEYDMREFMNGYDIFEGPARNWQSPAFRSILTWANKHPRMAKYEYIEPLIESLRQYINEPLPMEEYSGF